MDFKEVLQIILKEFEKKGVRYGLIGGFALGVLGVSRATLDLDFLVLKEDLPKVQEIMAELDYKCAYKSEDVSQYVSGVKIFGEVDFLHAFRSASIDMLGRAIEKKVFNGEIRVKVLIPEDIIGLKLQAAENDKSRSAKEFADIEALMDYHKGKLDWGLIEEYFNLFENRKKFSGLRQKYGKA